MDYTKIVKVLSLAATGNSIDAALDEMSKKELECLLELCEALVMIDKESETIEYLVSILLTFTSDQMAVFVAGAQEIIAQYTPKN